MKKILVKFTGRPTKLQDGSKMISATPVLDGEYITIEDDENQAVQIGDKRTDQLRDLGIKPGMRFVVIKNDGGLNPRNNFDAIWPLERLKTYQNGTVCDTCEHSLKNTEYHRYMFDECQNCGDGLNITASFTIDKNYNPHF